MDADDGRSTGLFGQSREGGGGSRPSCGRPLADDNDDDTLLSVFEGVSRFLQHKGHGFQTVRRITRYLEMSLLSIYNHGIRHRSRP